ncbi:uncharacterized protein LOC117169551 isoform X2 [Belonocnema kinseyi]|uniref:uncharacterized protein LOC117169551 isoform X2 n=1 Tax=Belonocnema kinseyi TaxID=2817044 RepID=UPI00143CCA38|nr:uncharacterized protein LOC117169551 isoform X2 [Belonocnema kinseyi]
MRSPDLFDRLLPPHYGHRITFFLIFLCMTRSESLFTKGKEYIYSYEAISNTGVLLPSRASSSWGFEGILSIKAGENSTFMQLQSIKTNSWNGPNDKKGENVDINGSIKELLKPFKVEYKMGLIDNFSVEAEQVWATNIKRGIAGVFQLDLSNLERQMAFNSNEVNHYGHCSIECVVTNESSTEKLIRKTVDPRTCRGHPHRTWSNVPQMQCPNNDQNPLLKSSERLYRVFSNDSEVTISFVNATGGIYVQPFQSLGEAQYIFTQQHFQILSVKNISASNELKSDPMQIKNLQHELPGTDLTQGRGALEKETVFETIAVLLDRLSQRLENPGLDTEINNLHNTTISVLLYYLESLNREDLQIVYNSISGTSYKDETVRNIFLEALPQIGSSEAALFVLDLIQQKKVSDITSIQLLTHLPFHIRKPEIQLLVTLQPLLNFPDKIAVEVQNTGILTYGTLIYKTCLSYCPYEMLDDYVRLYLDKFTESPLYEKKMVWLEGLANIQLGRVVEFLEPIASGTNSESRHLRVLAAWASLPTAPLRPDVIYPVYWPILINRTEHLELRIAALTLLIVSNPSPSRLISLFWYMKGEPDLHLYNFFYTTLKSMERTNFPCYVHIGGLAAQFTRMLHKSSKNEFIITGNYLFDYQDTYRHFGAMIHGIIIANPLTNIPEVAYVTLNNHGSGINLNHVSLYIKAEGFLHTMTTYLDNPTRVEDILKQFKINEKSINPAHFEIIARVQEKAVLCLHLNRTSLVKVFKYLDSLQQSTFHLYQNMEFHINQQRVTVPLTIESIHVTDLGTNVRIAATATSLFSMRGNFTHVPNSRNNHVIFRTSIHGTQVIENYNPLTDLWYGAQRAQSVHGYLPINVTFGLQEKLFVSYNTPAEGLKLGVTAHVRTITTIRGSRVNEKLKTICPKCITQYTVNKNPTEPMKTKTLYESNVPELGGHLRVKIFDCEKIISKENIFRNVMLSHRSNYQNWPVIEFILMGIHYVDYFTYVPPRGSCGVVAHIEPISSHSTEVKLEYSKSDKYHLVSLKHKDLTSSEVLDQWNLAIFYEITSWISDSLKIKASKTAPGQKVLKFCFEGEREVPWEWNFLSTKASDPSSVKMNLVWGLADSAKGKCSGSSLLIKLSGEVSREQAFSSLEDKWPYNVCRKETEGKAFVPYTQACYETSRQLSTLRNYQANVKFENVGWRMRAFYDLIGGNSSSLDLNDMNEFTIKAKFPAEANEGELLLNNDKIDIEYDPDIVDYFLVRTRLHKFTDNPLLRALFSTCILSTNSVSSSHNISIPLEKNHEMLVLGHCYDENPRLSLSAINTGSDVTLILNDESDSLNITSFKKGGALYNYTSILHIERNFQFVSQGSKWVRLDEKSVDVLLSEFQIFIHWTQEHVLLFYPNFIQEFTCGACNALNPNTDGFYKKFSDLDTTNEKINFIH